MEKKEIIKRLINFLKGITKRCLIIDTNNTEGMSKLTLNILVKEFTTPLNIAIVSPSEKFFNEIFPTAKDGIKLNTNYSVGVHKISFHIFEKSFVKTPPKDTEILIVHPIDGIKDKDLLKVLEGSKKMKKAILLADSINDVRKTFKKFNVDFFSLKPPEDVSYYDVMKQKLFDIK